MASSTTAPRWRPSSTGRGAAPRTPRCCWRRSRRSASTARSRAPTACSPSRLSTARSRTLHLARDRLGIKPLYWTRQNGTFAFASELKALRAAGGLAFAIDPGALASYLRYACVPAPATIFRDVAKLAPGHRVEARADGVTVHRYWDVAEVARRGQQALDLRPEPDIVEELHDLLADAVKRQMVSRRAARRVPVRRHRFLDGGRPDAARGEPAGQDLLDRISRAGVQRGRHAKAVAHHLGTDHTELVLSAADAQAIIPQLPAIYDEPFADSSQLPTFLVSRLARGQVTVALSGDGGDEVFGGYVRYQGIARLAGVARRLPGPLRRLAATAIELVSADAWDMLARALPSLQAEPRGRQDPQGRLDPRRRTTRSRCTGAWCPTRRSRRASCPA